MRRTQLLSLCPFFALQFKLGAQIAGGTVALGGLAGLGIWAYNKHAEKEKKEVRFQPSVFLALQLRLLLTFSHCCAVLRPGSSQTSPRRSSTTALRLERTRITARGASRCPSLGGFWLRRVEGCPKGRSRSDRRRMASICASFL